MNNTLSLHRAVMLLKLSSYSLLVFAAFWWLAAVPGYDRPAQLLLDLMVWPIDGGHDQLTIDARFLSAIGAGLLAAFAILLLLVVIPEVKRGNGSVLRGTAIAIVTWYVVDSVGCIFAGVASNVVLNTIYAAAMLVPLWLVSRAMKGGDSDKLK